MSQLQVTPEEYLTQIIMSEDSVLLVEGSDDEIFFTLLYNRLKEYYSKSSVEKLKILKKVRIDTAEEIQAPLGNREKVELVCKLALRADYKDACQKILGFVDREFREFDYTKLLQDKVNGHKIDGRLIWANGHSIENYFFDISTFKETFNTYPITSFYLEAFHLFESKFTDILKIACCLSLAAHSTNLCKLVGDTLDWKCIEIKSQSMQLNTTEWETRLKKKNLDQTRIDTIINEFNKNLDIVSTSHIEVVRLLSHGHIGFNLMFAVYGKCLYTVCVYNSIANPDKEANKINENKHMRFSLCAKAWNINNQLQLELSDSVDFPLRCFYLLIKEHLNLSS
ncbi:MAG TPA: DUF4435 domain-containing protein [Kamptonema sp.]|nr:DUF4435 domain-containing protein [Kamptonema sp.]